jgi:hypothetical protein
LTKKETKAYEKYNNTRFRTKQLHRHPGRGKAKILAKIGNSVVEPLLKSVRTAEEMREIEKRIA